MTPDFKAEDINDTQYITIAIIRTHIYFNTNISYCSLLNGLYETICPWLCFVFLLSFDCFSSVPLDKNSLISLGVAGIPSALDNYNSFGAPGRLYFIYIDKISSIL